MDTMMMEITPWMLVGVAIGLMLVAEGIFYTIMPDQIKSLMRYLLTVSSNRIRLVGLGSVIAGALILWLLL